MSLTKKAILMWKLILSANLLVNKNVRRRTGSVPQSPTKAIRRKNIKLLQMGLNSRNKISKIAKLIKELRKKRHSNSHLEAALEDKLTVFFLFYQKPVSKF